MWSVVKEVGELLPHRLNHAASGRGGNRAGAGRPRRAGVDDAITSATLDLLIAVGYQRLTVDEVARRADVAAATVYRRWPSKSSLVAAAATSATLTPLTPPDTGSFRRDLDAIVDATYRFFTGPQGKIMRILVTHSADDEELLNVVKSTTQLRRDGIYSMVERAKARNEIASTLDPELVADLFVGPLWTRLLVTGGRITRPLVQQVADLAAAALSNTGTAGGAGRR